MEFPTVRITICEKLSAKRLSNLDNNNLNAYKWNVSADKNQIF